MAVSCPQSPHQPHPLRRKALTLALVGTASLLLAGCKYEMASFNCKQEQRNSLWVAQDQTCRFKYDEGDVARYVVIVTRKPAFGEAKAEGKYLTYVARPGFVGEDRLNIKVERRGVGHVQWRNLAVTVKVGTAG